MQKNIVTIFFICFTALLSAQNLKIIHAGTLLAVPGTSPTKNQSIIVENNSIKEVRNGFITAEQAGYTNEDVIIIDLKNHFVLPGLMDMHTHITGERDPNANPYEWIKLEEADNAYRAIPYAKRTLQAGFTTIRNLCGDSNVMNALKRAINSGLVEGPRILATTGAISATG